MLNGLSYGLLLFMLSSGLTLIFSMMGVLEFCAHQLLHAGRVFRLYAHGRHRLLARTCSLPPCWWARWGALFERYSLRKVHHYGHVPELLVTFGLSYLILEVVQLVWGRGTRALRRCPPRFRGRCSRCTARSSPSRAPS